LRLIFDSFLDGVEAPPLVGQVEGLEDQREGRVVTAHALHGSLQRQEAMFLKSFIYGQFKFMSITLIGIKRPGMKLTK
jgi:hypothetical protein